MTDLHCHILPGMDDGAKDTAVSLELLRGEYEDGVRNIAFTSHFNSERTTVEAFTAKRQAAFEQLTAALEGQPMQFDFKLGAEVFFSPGLQSSLFYRGAAESERRPRPCPARKHLRA